MENGDDRRAGQFDKMAMSETDGCEEYVKDLLLKPISHDLQGNDDDLRVISVVNSEATGKTALARRVYGTLDVKRWFAYRAWVRVQDNYSVVDFLANILRQISTSELTDVDQANEIELSERLHAYFLKRRYLVVLDNVKSVNLAAKILRFLPDFSNGSRVIITTRDVEMPYLIDPWLDPIKFDPSTEGARKKLLLPSSNEIKPDGQDHPAGLQLMQRILSRCSLSPAGIRLLDGLLSVTQENGKFEAMIGHLPENPSLMDVVSLCYDGLSQELQNCLMYVCQFPREYEIPTRRLLRLWLAESLSPESSGGIQNAEKCFQELVCRNMIQVVSRGKGHGFAKTCRMPGFVYDFLLQKALEKGFFEIYSYDSSINIPKVAPKFFARRIVVDKSSTDHKLGRSLEAQEQSNQERYNVKQLHSYISFNTKKIRMQKGELDIFLKSKGVKSSLEVLDLEGVYKPVLPKKLGNVLLNLKYLGLRWTILHELPKSVGDLPCLETLDVKHTNIAKVPSSIWTKKSLRHLYLNEVSMDKSIPKRRRLSSSSKLQDVNNLQTLCGLHFEANSTILDVLSKSTGITKLSLTCPSTVVKEVIQCIKGLKTLESLKLKSKDLLGQPSKVYPEDMNGLMSLSNLYLFGDLGGNNLSFLPQNLKSLTLSMSFLATNTLDVLGTLQCLNELRLYAFSYNGTTLNCAQGTFPRLSILKLWKLGNLKSLMVEKEAMPFLEELEIRDCQKLEEIQVLGERKKLKEVGLAKVREELAESLKASLGESVIMTKELIVSATAAEG